MDNHIQVKTWLKKKSFTLIEILVVFSILTVLMGIAFTAIRLNEAYRDLTFIRIQLYRQNKRAHDAIAEELEKSNASASIGTTAVWSPPTCNPCTDNWLYFKIPLVNSIDNTTYSIPWGARYENSDYVDHYIKYSLNPVKRTLLREVINSDFSSETGTQEIKATDIVDLTITNVVTNCTNCIGISTTARKTTLPPQRNMTDSMNSTVYLLN